MADKVVNNTGIKKNTTAGKVNMKALPVDPCQKKVEMARTAKRKRKKAKGNQNQ